MTACQPPTIGYTSLVPAHVGIGGDSPKIRRRNRACTVRFFHARSMAVPVMGRLCVGSRKARRFLIPVCQPAHSRPALTFDSVAAGYHAKIRSQS